MEKAFVEIDEWIRRYVENPRCPKFVGKIYGKFRELCSYSVRMNN